MTDRDEKSKSTLVVKSNELIESNMKGFSLIQTKLLNLAISQLKPDTPLGFWFEFESSYLLDVLGLGSKNHIELRKATLSMLRGIEIKDDDKIMQRPLIVTDYLMGEGIVRFRFDHDAQPYLADLKEKYTKYYFENIQRISSTYAIRLYELLKQYQKIGKREFLIKDLRFYLDIKESQYLKYSNFKSRVLLISEREINEKTDLKISFEEIKTGRKITKIVFYISSQKRQLEEKEIKNDVKEISINNQADMFGGFDDFEKESIDYLMGQFKFSENESTEYIKLLGAEFVNDATKIVYEKRDTIKNHKAYMKAILDSAIENNDFWKTKPPTKKEKVIDFEKIQKVANEKLKLLEEIKIIKNLQYIKALKDKNPLLLESLNDYKKSPPYATTAKHLTSNELHIITKNDFDFFTLESKKSWYTMAIKTVKANYIKKEIESWNLKLPE